MNREKLIFWLTGSVWLAIALYGLIFNLTYIDEAKYIIKGWLITTGQISYYRTPDFFYQHLPGSLLWYGLGQKLFGPSLLVARLQSLIIGTIIFWLSFVLAKRLGGIKAGLTTLILLCLAPATALYYSAAVPQSLVGLFLLLGLICLNKRQYTLATISFSLTFVIRENFIFSLGLYLLYLAYIYRRNLKFFGINVLVASITLAIFFLPGLPGTIEVLRNLPFISQFLPVDQAAKNILSLYWKEDLQNRALEFRALKEFAIIFHAWLIIFGWTIVKKIRPIKKNTFLVFLLTLAIMNFLIHFMAAFKLSPRAIVSYFAYVAPLFAVIGGIKLAPYLKKFLPGYFLLLFLVPLSMRFVAVFALPSRQPDLLVTYQSAKTLIPLIKENENILWLGEPLSLYLTGKVSYYPLINHTGFYKPSLDTDTVKRLGFWNLAMLESWLDISDLVVIDENKIKLLEASSQGKNVAQYLKQQLSANFVLADKHEDIWPGQLSFYRRD